MTSAPLGSTAQDAASCCCASTANSTDNILIALRLALSKQPMKRRLDIALWSVDAPPRSSAPVNLLRLEVLVGT